MNRNLNFIVKGNEYKIAYPRTGDFVDITTLKFDLTNGRYEQMAVSKLQTIYDAAIIVDMQAHVTVLCADAIKDLHVSNIRDLYPSDLKELLKAYTEQMKPWIEKWQKLFNTIIEDDDDKNEK